MLNSGEDGNIERQLGHIFVGPAVEYWSLALKYGTRPVSNDSQDDCHTIFPFSGGLGGASSEEGRMERMRSLCNTTTS